MTSGWATLRAVRAFSMLSHAICLIRIWRIATRFWFEPEVRWKRRKTTRTPAPRNSSQKLKKERAARSSFAPGTSASAKNLGYNAEGSPAPMIDQVHRLMHLWKAGDLIRVDEYVDSRALRRNALFHQLLQALIELAPTGTEERSLLESISNHLAARGPVAERVQMDLPT